MRYWRRKGEVALADEGLPFPGHLILGQNRTFSGLQQGDKFPPLWTIWFTLRIVVFHHIWIIPVDPKVVNAGQRLAR